MPLTHIINIVVLAIVIVIVIIVIIVIVIIVILMVIAHWFCNRPDSLPRKIKLKLCGKKLQIRPALTTTAQRRGFLKLEIISCIRTEP